MGARETLGGLTVAEESTWSAAESARFADPLLDNAACFARHPTPRTVLTLAKVRRGGELVGVAPLLRLVRYRGTRLLEPRSRRWMDPLLGPFARATTCMVDTSFMAFRYGEPFLVVDPADLPAVRDAVVRHVLGSRDVDALMVSEPAGDAGWARERGFRSFLQLPLVRVDLDGVATFGEHLARVGQKRRRNARKERQLFTDAGATVELHEPPLAEDLARTLHELLLQSSRENAAVMEIPFEDLMNSEPAFREQPQSVLVARLDGVVVGFFAFIRHAGVLHQCHGGFDYARSRAIKAYPNLIHAAVEHALEVGARAVTLGPLNNEAKRRAGSLCPVMMSVGCRSALTRVAMERVLIPRFQIYGGPVEAAARG